MLATDACLRQSEACTEECHRVAALNGLDLVLSESSIQFGGVRVSEGTENLNRRARERGSQKEDGNTGERGKGEEGCFLCAECG